MQKKRFSVRDDKLQGAIGGLLQDQEMVGEGRLENLPIAMIQVSPDNPRYIGRIPPQEIIDHREGRLDLSQEEGDKGAFFKSIVEIAQSIERRGLLQPIVVKEAGEGFIIMVGERRYLAHLLLGRERIRAIIRPRAEELEERSIRLIENLQRENLGFQEIIRAIEELDRIFQLQQGRPMDSVDLSAELHKHDSTCRRYLQIVRGPVDVRMAVEQGKVTGLRPALALLDLETPEERERALQGLANKSATEATLRNPKPITIADASEVKRRGRRRQQINLGGVKKISVVQRLMQSIMGERGFEEAHGSLDWSDMDLIQEIWDGFIQSLERETPE